MRKLLDSKASAFQVGHFAPDRFMAPSNDMIVTWAYHFTTESPSWTVEPVWLDRVEEVVDWVLERDFHGLLNVHHDSWVWADLAASNANYTLIEEKFYQLWYQIGTRFGCKSSKLAFEPLNEPTGSTEEHAAELNKLNRIFLQAISDAGGFNSQRVVTLVGLGEDSIKTSQWFERPTNITNPWAIQYHYYSPCEYYFPDHQFAITHTFTR